MLTQADIKDLENKRRPAPGAPDGGGGPPPRKRQATLYTTVTLISSLIRHSLPYRMGENGEEQLQQQQSPSAPVRRRTMVADVVNTGNGELVDDSHNGPTTVGHRSKIFGD